MSPEVLALLTTIQETLTQMQQDFHTTMLIAIGIAAGTLALVGAMFVWGWLATSRIRTEAAKYAADAEARMQAILAQTRRQP
jgi:nitroreductase